MSLMATDRLMTLEEFLAIPDDGIDRDLIRGRLVEHSTMTRRNRRHGRVETRIARFLDSWLDTQPEPRGQIVSGEAGFVLSRSPDSTVGIDVAYVSAKVADAAPDSQFFEGPPILAVEILSPSDAREDIDDKVLLYLESDVALVWVVSPRFRTVTVFRPDAAPVLFNEHQELTAEPHLSGFKVAVARLFGG